MLNSQPNNCFVYDVSTMKCNFKRKKLCYFYRLTIKFLLHFHHKTSPFLLISKLWFSKYFLFTSISTTLKILLLLTLNFLDHLWSDEVIPYKYNQALMYYLQI